MKKKPPVTIKELDIQPISDDDLRAFEINGGADSDYWNWVCNCDSRDERWYCVRERDQ
jgi:hypothetical protein